MLLIFALLYLTYQNVVDALRVFTGVPLGWVGGIIALWLRDMPFSISAAIGFIALFGQAVLVKINVDENPQASAAFRVQSIPAVYALRDRQVVNGFIGAQGEDAVRQFVTSVLPSETDQKIAALVAAGDEASLRTALELEPGNEAAIVALAELLVGAGEGDEALALLERIPETAETRRVAALARVGREFSSDGDAGSDVTAKLDGLLERVRDDEQARQEFVDLLELLGPTDPRTVQYRRALTSKLF